MASGVVVGSIFLSCDQLFRVKQLMVVAGSDLVNHRRLKIDEDGSWNVLSGSGFREKGAEGIVSAPDGLVRRHLPVRMDSVLEAEKVN